MPIASSLKSINELLEGGYEPEIPVAIFGLPESGKTIFLSQEACFISKVLNSNSLMIDTEGGSYALLKKWIPVFSKRFSTDISLIKLKVEDSKISFIDDISQANVPAIYIINLRDIKSFMSFFGYNIDISVSDKGKYGLRFLGKADSLIGSFTEEYDISLIVIDSVSNPLAIFSGGLVNFPARADALKLLFSAIQTIAENKEILTLMSHHATFDPENPYSEPSMYGGKWVKHNTKISLYFQETKSKKKEHAGIRKVYLTRYFDKPRFSVMRKIRLCEQGFIDVEVSEGDEE